MITVSVTSDSGLHELKVVNKLISDLIASREESNAKKNTLTVKVDASDVMPMVHEAIEQAKAEIFNATELAEAEQLGKPVCSTVDAVASPTAHVDMKVNTSIPTPQSVFGQPAQTTANVANPVVPVTDDLAVDADGLTWDARIHSSSRELNKDGTWRKRRGVNTDLVATVEAELRGERHDITDLMSETGYVPVTPIPQSKPPVDHSHEGETPVFTATIPTEMTFPELLDGVTKAMVAGQLTQARINEALNSIGVQALPHLIARADLIPVFREALGGVV